MDDFFSKNKIWKNKIFVQEIFDENLWFLGNYYIYSIIKIVFFVTVFILYIKLITICRCLSGPLILIRLYLTKQKYREGNKYVIPYFYQAGYSEELKTDISRALADLGDNTCIDFKVVNESSKGLSSFCHYYVTKKFICHQKLVMKKSRVLKATFF